MAHLKINSTDTFTALLHESDSFVYSSFFSVACVLRLVQANATVNETITMFCIKKPSGVLALFTEYARVTCNVQRVLALLLIMAAARASGYSVLKQ